MPYRDHGKPMRQGLVRRVRRTLSRAGGRVRRDVPRRALRGVALLGLCVALAACASVTTTTASSTPGAAAPVSQAPRGPSTIPRTALALGDYRRAGADAVSRGFAETI